MPEHFYVYPAYLREGTTRRLGRRVPAGSALTDVSAEEIVSAGRHLGYALELEAGKQYPRQAHTYAGRVKVSKKGGATKARFLAAVAAEIRRSRPARPSGAGGAR